MGSGGPLASPSRKLSRTPLNTVIGGSQQGPLASSSPRADAGHLITTPRSKESSESDSRNVSWEDGGHILVLPGTSPLDSSPRASPLGTLDRSTSSQRWVVVDGSPRASSTHTDVDHPRAGGLAPLQLFVGADSRSLSLETNSEAVLIGRAEEQDLPPITAPKVKPWLKQLPSIAAGTPAAASQLPPLTASPRGTAKGAELGNSSDPGTVWSSGGGSPQNGGRWWPPMAALREGFSSLRFSPAAAVEAQHWGAQQHPETNDNVEMVSFAEGGGGESLAGAAYQVVALRRPALTDSGMHALEVAFLVECANGMLGGPRQRLQLTSALTQLADGIILQLLNASAEGLVDERVLNKSPVEGGHISPRECNENARLFLDAARAVGCFLGEISPEDITQRQAAAVVECLWEVIQLDLLKGVSLQAVPAVVLLKQSQEEVTQLAALNPELLLERWLLHHIQGIGAAEDAEAWSPGVGVAAPGSSSPSPYQYATLLHTLEPSLCGEDTLRGLSQPRLWEAVVAAAATLGASPLPRPPALAAGSRRLHTTFAAAIFRARHGLRGDAASVEAMQAEALAHVGADEARSREERTYRIWINSMVAADSPAGHVSGDLAGDLADGFVLLSAMDAVLPGAVEWKRVHRPPFKPLYRRPNSLENCNQVMKIMREKMHLPLVNIGGEDICNEEAKLVRALLWQLMRFHCRQLMQSVKSHGAAISDAQLDAEVLGWANEQVATSGLGTRQLASFGDRSVASGLFLVDLLAAVEPAAIDARIVTPGRTPEERELNARYVVSAARKMGCSMPLLWEDIAEARSPKSILAFIAALLAHSTRKSQA